MSDLRQNLKSEFRNEDYRYAYAESFLNTKLATQIKALREARGKTQVELGNLAGTKQSGFSRFEDVNHSVWKTDTLWKIARGLGVRLDISFETFGSLIDEKERFSREYLLRPDFEHDPTFTEVAEAEAAEPQDNAEVACLAATLVGFHRVRIPSGFELAVPWQWIRGAGFGNAIRLGSMAPLATAEPTEIAGSSQGVAGPPLLASPALSGAMASPEESQKGIHIVRKRPADQVTQAVNPEVSSRVA